MYKHNLSALRKDLELINEQFESILIGCCELAGNVPLIMLDHDAYKNLPKNATIEDYLNYLGEKDTMLEPVLFDFLQIELNTEYSTVLLVIAVDVERKMIICVENEDDFDFDKNVLSFITTREFKNSIEVIWVLEEINRVVYENF